MEELDREEQDGGQGPGFNKAWAIAIAVIVIAGLVVALVVSRSKTDAPEVTLETINSKLVAAEANLGNDIGGVKADVAWAKEKLADLNDETGDNGDILNDILGRLNAIDNTIDSQNEEIALLTGQVNATNMRLEACNCTLEKGA